MRRSKKTVLTYAILIWVCHNHLAFPHVNFPLAGCINIKNLGIYYINVLKFHDPISGCVTPNLQLHVRNFNLRSPGDDDVLTMQTTSGYWQEHLWLILFATCPLIQSVKNIPPKWATCIRVAFVKSNWTVTTLYFCDEVVFSHKTCEVEQGFVSGAHLKTIRSYYVIWRSLFHLRNRIYFERWFE